MKVGVLPSIRHPLNDSPLLMRLRLSVVAIRRNSRNQERTSEVAQQKNQGQAQQ